MGAKVYNELQQECRKIDYHKEIEKKLQEHFK